MLTAVLIGGLYQNSFAQTSKQKPNIVYIYGDDIGYDDLSCNGAKTISTPNVDQLAEEGVLFTNLTVQLRIVKISLRAG